MTVPIVFVFAVVINELFYEHLLTSGMCGQWAEALQVFMRAADELGLVSRKSLWGQFWSSHQRFFKYLCIAAKVRCLVELAQKELKAGKVSTTHTCALSHIVCLIWNTINDPEKNSSRQALFLYVVYVGRNTEI